MAFSNSNKVSLSGKTVIVTGANTGIGYETALECAKRGGRVILACRDETKGLKAIETIQKLTANKNVILKRLDLASLNSVREFAQDILKNERRLDILINNAGAIMLGNQTTIDGFQLEMQVNYLAPVLITMLLLDLLKKSAPSRIVNVSSKAAKYAKKFTPEQINSYKSHVNAYSNSKLGNILFTQVLAEKLKDFNVSVFSLHPGAIYTDIAIQHLNPCIQSCGKCFSNIFLKTPVEGSQTTLYVALEQGIEHLTGRHFEECKVVKSYSTAKDPKQAKQIWDSTLKLLSYDENETIRI